jgi:hypothetical protein
MQSISFEGSVRRKKPRVFCLCPLGLRYFSLYGPWNGSDTELRLCVNPFFLMDYSDVYLHKFSVDTNLEVTRGSTSGVIVFQTHTAFWILFSVHMVSNIMQVELVFLGLKLILQCCKNHQVLIKLGQNFDSWEHEEITTYRTIIFFRMTGFLEFVHRPVF